MTPIEVLQEELHKWENSLVKLEQAILNGQIPDSVYNERKNNILPKISSYKQAIAILKANDID